MRDDEGKGSWSRRKTETETDRYRQAEKQGKTKSGRREVKDNTERLILCLISRVF